MAMTATAAARWHDTRVYRDSANHVDYRDHMDRANDINDLASRSSGPPFGPYGPASRLGNGSFPTGGRRGGRGAAKHYPSQNF